MNFMLLVLQFLHFLGCYKIYCLNKMSFFPFSLHEKIVCKICFGAEIQIHSKYRIFAMVENSNSSKNASDKREYICATFCQSKHDLRLQRRQVGLLFPSLESYTCHRTKGFFSSPGE